MKKNLDVHHSFWLFFCELGLIPLFYWHSEQLSDLYLLTKFLLISQVVTVINAYFLSNLS